MTAVRILLLGLLALPGVVGCARMPAEADGGFPTRRLTVTLVMDAPIRSDYHYFVAVNDDGDPLHGPVPLIATPSTPIPPSGVPIIIYDTELPPRYYCWLTANTFSQYRNSVYTGPPYRGEVSGDGRTITYTLDIDEITDEDRIELNLITADRLIPPDDPLVPIVYDGLGDTGNSYLSDLSLRENAIYSNATASSPEQAGDCPIESLDIVDWSVEVSVE